ncbi:Exosome complex component Rrp41 [uncultured archaeon]|nr:Exosome complex component Rrp41 [uncultured archaeon]
MDELRPLTIKAEVLNKADGSAYIAWGKNKIIAAVYGPRECIPKHDENPYKALVRCTYRMSPFCSLEEHGRRGPSRRGTEISKLISNVFDSVVMAEYYPKTAIDIFIEVLQADGGTRVAGLTAAAVALADAGIPMKDIVCGVAAGKIDGEVAVDFGKYEDNFGESDVPVAVSPRTGELLLLQMDGMLTKEEVARSIDMAIVGCKKVHAIQVEALKARYAEKERQGALGGNGEVDENLPATQAGGRQGMALQPVPGESGEGAQS